MGKPWPGRISEGEMQIYPRKGDVREDLKSGVFFGASRWSPRGEIRNRASWQGKKGCPWQQGSQEEEPA